jgi:hypothetical protein
MTEHKLLKYLSKTVELPEGDKHLTPVVFTDSKGTCLERYSQNILANSIKWWSQSGRSSTKKLIILITLLFTFGLVPVI